MSFFKDNATYAEGGDYSLAEDGIYACRLKEIECLKQPSFDDPNLMEDAFKWVFEADETDDDGKPYRFIKFTKTSYSNEKAALTILVDGMLGRHLTKEEFADLDLDDLKAKKYRVNVELTQNKKGKDINKILWVKANKASDGGKKMGALAGGSKAGKVADADDIGDPFAE